MVHAHLVPTVFRRRHLCLLLALMGAGISPVVAEEALQLADAGSARSGRMLRPTVVTATRYEAEPDQLTATVTSINREQLEQRLPLDEADLFRDQQDVVMARDMRRHGSTRVNIRGIEDNRVLQLVDGVRLPDFFNGSGPTNYTMSTSAAPMTDFLRQVEIVRGPASSLYGSDALGGVVGYLTLEPQDLLRDDAKYGVRLRGGYSSANDALSGSVVGAARGERVDMLLAYAQANGHETGNMGTDDSFGPNRSTPNPADTQDRGALAKVVWRPQAGHKLTAALEGRKQDVQTEIMRIPASLSKITSMQGDDQSERSRFGLEYQHTPAGSFYQRLLARAYYQDAKTDNLNRQRRSNTTYSTASGCSASRPGTASCDIEQRFQLEQTTAGLGLQFDSEWQQGDIGHLFSYGLDLMRQNVSTLRDGTVVNVATGAVTHALAGENYPLRDFADGQTDTIGLYLQDEIAFQDRRFLLTPGLRYDHTDLQPKVDDLAQQVLTVIKREAVAQTHSRVSPKLGAQWNLQPQLALFGQIASGFRAPNYNEVNGAFRNAAQMYATVPNPDLRPETSVGVELGLRGRSGPLNGQFALFDNRYKDFIENVKLNCPSDPSCINIAGVPYTTYMSQNLSRVRIWGAELRGGWALAPQWRADMAVAYAHGDNTETHQPLNSVEPLRGMLGLSWDNSVFGSDLRLNAAQSKNRVDDSSGEWFKTPAYAVVDLAGWYKPSANSKLVLAVNNLFDRKYWLWSDIRNADGYNPTAPEFYTQPGRNLRLSVQADF